MELLTFDSKIGIDVKYIRDGDGDVQTHTYMKSLCHTNCVCAGTLFTFHLVRARSQLEIFNSLVGGSAAGVDMDILM